MGILNILNSDFGDLGDRILDEYIDDIEKKNFDKNCLPVISFDRCHKWALDMKKQYPQSAGFVIAVKDNPDPRNENDRICVIIGMIDANSKVITIDGQHGISTIIHGKTIDEKFLDTLNGKLSLKFMFK